MNARELSTILAALRLWQDRNMPAGLHPRKVLDLEQVIATEHGPALDTEEIDALCERLNAKHEIEAEALKRALPYIESAAAEDSDCDGDLACIRAALGKTKGTAPQWPRYTKSALETLHERGENTDHVEHYYDEADQTRDLCVTTTEREDFEADEDVRLDADVIPNDTFNRLLNWATQGGTL